MDRANKSNSGRGGKSKTPLFPTDLYALGSKSSNDGKPRPTTTTLVPKVGPLTTDPKKRDPPPTVCPPSKKPKIAPVGGRVDAQPDAWETLAVDSDPSDFAAQVLEAIGADDHDQMVYLICGAIKAVKNGRYKTDAVIFESLCYIAKVRNRVFTSYPIVSAITSLLRRDMAILFKSKGNLHPLMLSANLLMTAYAEVKKWPDVFMKVYVEDAGGDRCWVDLEYCKEFVENILYSSGTRKATTPWPEPGLPALPGQPHEPEETTPNKPSTLPAFPSPTSRFRWNRDVVENIVMDFVKEQLNRKPGAEMINRNLIKLVTSLCGISDLRHLIVPKLEGWLQNSKLVRVSQELLMSVCANTSSQTLRDVEIISIVIKMRLKTKGLVNSYLACIKELISVHKDNLATALKHTIYHELSSPRNPNNNMAILSTIFQTDPEKATKHLALIFLELLYNREDYLASVKTLLRELGRILRGDLRLHTLVATLFSKEDALPRDADPVRSFASVADLGCLAVFLAVMPHARGDKKDAHQVDKINTLVSKMQNEAIKWLFSSAIPVYKPSPQEFVNILHKLLFMEPCEVYGKVDNWPEGERALLLRLATEVTVLDDTLITLLLMGILKEYPITPQDSLDIVEQLVKRAAMLPSLPKLLMPVGKMKLVDSILNAAAYHHPENIDLPAGYTPPALAITVCYWKAWTILLILAAHNPDQVGTLGWEWYPTLRTLMEMCITGNFVYPSGYEKHQMLALEKQKILEFEAHLAAATSKMEINESTSLLLSQVVSMEPRGPGRRPPSATLDYIKSLNSTLRLGHLLCRSRDPDFLLDLIQRQGPSQSMPWLADLVQSSDSAHLHMLPVQCLCEFLMSCCPKQESKYQELLAHLRMVVTSSEDGSSATEVLEYFLRRLASPSNRTMAIVALRLILEASSSDESSAVTIDSDRSFEDKSETAWLTHHLPLVPHFKVAKPLIIGCIRAACLVENDPNLVTAYLCFLAEHSIDDLNELSDLVLDMATLIVERVTIMMAILPWGTVQQPGQSHINPALDAFVTIFYNYLIKAREPRRGEYTWSESQDQVLVSWISGEECTIHILVVHAMVILLTYGCEGVSKLREYSALLDIWFPQNLEHTPKGFLVDTSEEALLIPDWLKLRMIRSDVPRLVEAALTDLDISQLILFIQSFGIPIPSMSKLLSTLDAVVLNQREAVGEAVLDKSYMAQLVEVQHRRGATGGLVFTKVLELELEKHPPDDPPPINHIISRRRRTNVRYSKVKKEGVPEAKTKSYFRSKPPLKQLPYPHVYIHFTQLLENLFTKEMDELSWTDFRSVLMAVSDAIQKGGRMEIHIFIQCLSKLTKWNHFEKQGTAMKFFSRPQWSIPLLCFLLRIYDETCESSIAFLMENLCECLKHAEDNNEVSSFVKYFIKVLGKIIMKGKKFGSRVAASTGKELQIHREASDASEGALIVQALDGLRYNHSKMKGHFVDILAREEPEIVGSYPVEQMEVLFRWDLQPVLPCRPLLLTLLTHDASWSTLQTCIDVLLTPVGVQTCDPFAVLDFLQALVCHPKLWQGREKHAPKNGFVDNILNLTLDQIKHMLDYILKEGLILIKSNVKAAFGNYTSKSKLDKIDLFASHRLLLIKQCISSNIQSAHHLATHLTNKMKQLKGYQFNVCNQLLVELYLTIPSMITKLDSFQVKNIYELSPISVLGPCAMDIMSHRLVTALSWGGPSGAAELELMARSMAATHPLLILRQMPLFASSLAGRADLEWAAFKTRGHLTYIQQVLALLPLLQPHIFREEYATSLHKTMGTFIEIFQNYGSEPIAVGTINTLVSEFIIFIEEYIKEDPKLAQDFLQAHAESIRDIQNDYPQMNTICVCIPVDGCDKINVFVLPGSSESPELPVHWNSKIQSIQTNQDPLLGLSYVEYTSGKKPSLLGDLVDTVICERLSSDSAQIRALAHTLLLRYLRYNPTAASQFVPVFLGLMESNKPEVVSMAVQKLPEFILLAQEHGLPLMKRLFELAICSENTLSDTIVKIIKSLNLQSAC